MLIRARLPRVMRAPQPTIFFALVVILSCMVMPSFSANETEILMKFKKSLTHSKALHNWDPIVSPCNGYRRNWTGIICFNGYVHGLRLENIGLSGTIDVDSLISLRYLRTLSFMNNTFTGPMPEIGKLSSLRSLYLSYNHFSGEIADDAFALTPFLREVFLANNEFTGPIPSSLASLPRLTMLRLDGNKFQGQIPDFQQRDLRKFNVSNNELKGSIPASLSRMDSSSFSGNEYLCGSPLVSCKHPKKTPSLRIAIIVLIVGFIVSVIALVFFIFYFYLKDKSSSLDRASTVNEQNESVVSHPCQVEHKPPEDRGRMKKAEHGKLLFVRDDREKFDLQELLRASAEVLGSTTFASSYKTTVKGQLVVVKRYKHMNYVGREEFREYMGKLGRLNHPNLLPIIAHHFRKEEKLVISDFVRNGKHPTLDWPTRLRIVKGVARGLAYLFEAMPSLVVPHGHLKSSNVLLDESFEPLLTDYALSPLINADLAQGYMIAYKSPEYAQHGRVTKKTDIWSLGVLILEILTGRFPENYLTLVRDNDLELARWVNTMIKERGTSGVFDLDMGKEKNNKSELLKLLKIGLSCCEEDVDRRLGMGEVIEMIEELKEGESAGEYTLSITNDGDKYTFRGV